MPKLLDILNANVGKTPDQIVVALTPQTVFELGVFEPWRCPPHLEGRRVLIEFRAEERIGWSWWREPGEGASPDRNEGYEWPIETAFGRFSSTQSFFRPHVRLHLVPE